MFWTFLEVTPAVGGSVQIDGKKGHHLARVLRVRPGEHGIAVYAGREYEVEVAAVDGARIDARVLADGPARGEPTTTIKLLQAVLPNPDFDAVPRGVPPSASGSLSPSRQRVPSAAPRPDASAVGRPSSSPPPSRVTAA